jgi:hypothetical protein
MRLHPDLSEVRAQVDTGEDLEISEFHFWSFDPERHALRFGLPGGKLEQNRRNPTGDAGKARLPGGQPVCPGAGGKTLLFLRRKPLKERRISFKS